jgi:DNA-binding GntR family transcriptional regulator
MRSGQIRLARREHGGAAYERLTEAITSGELEPGQPLVESVLAEWCQVSRTPVREALKRLEQDGLVVRGDRGLSVREHSREEILDLYDTRIVLDSAATRTAAFRRSQVDLLTLRGILHRLDAIVPHEEDAMTAGNREFHHAVWRSSHNEPLLDVLRLLDRRVARYRSTTLSHPGRWAEGNREHRLILAAIEGGDGERAAALTAAHFGTARRLRLEQWARGQE